MNKSSFIVINILLSFFSVNAQCPSLVTLCSTPCSDNNIRCEGSLNNPCVTDKISATIYYSPPPPYSPPININVTIDFGDGSPIQIDPYSTSTSNFILIETTHIYPAPGNYLVSITLNGPGVCSYFLSQNITASSGYCNSTCATYGILSTGFDRINNTLLPPPPAPPAPGNWDPNWFVVKRQDVTGSPYTPIPGTIVNYSGVLAYDINPNLTNYPSLGSSRYISVNPDANTVASIPNIVTYRTYFNLPNPLPTNKKYSLAMRIRADDAVYQVSLNNFDIMPLGYANTGGSYQGPPLDLSFTSCNVFSAGSNYIDISVGDLGLIYTQLDAEILLYECPGVCGASSPPCSDCISSFAPIPGKKYLLSAWAKEKNPVQSKTSYTFPSINVLYPSISGSAGPFAPSGAIIDGWQRIEGEFTIPANATDLTVKLNCSTSDCYFDDVRVLPFDGSMKSYVYDPVNMRLVAELDERNYATLYEYDEEGKLIRVKKETEKGKMTIQENRSNTKK